jgi:hypothetical protein
MSLQETMKQKLESVGLPYKEIKCYGSQIMITAHSEGAAKQWAGILAKFSRVRGMVTSVDHAKVNKNTVMKPSLVQVWRVWSTI